MSTCIEHNSEDDKNIPIPLQDLKIFTYQYENYLIEWNDHLKLWCPETNEFLYHWDDRLIPKKYSRNYDVKEIDQTEHNNRRYHSDQYSRVYSKICGCFNGYSTSDTYGNHPPGTMFKYSNEKKDCVDKFKEVRIFRNNSDGSRTFLTCLSRNIYRTKEDNEKFFIIKFFHWQNELYFLFNENYGQIGVYHINSNISSNISNNSNNNNSITKYMDYITDCFNDQIYLVDNDKKFVMYHWIWHPFMYYSYYNIDKFMTVNKNHSGKYSDDEITEKKKQNPYYDPDQQKLSPYQGESFYDISPYGDGMDFFKLIDSADYFLYYFHEKYWRNKQKKWMLKKYGKEANNTILKITYQDYEEMLSQNIYFPHIDENVCCRKCGCNIYIDCDCEQRKKYKFKDCLECNSSYILEQCACQNKKYNHRDDEDSDYN